MPSIRMGLPMYLGQLDVNELPVSDGSGTAPKPPETPTAPREDGTAPATPESATGTTSSSGA